MIPTVRDVVALPVVQAGVPEVVSAECLDRPVRWVHVSDMPDLAGLLQGGELVLTTGSALRDAPRDYLDRMARAGVVGVVVELGTRITSLPDSAGRIARSLGLPLVLLHRQDQVRRSHRSGAPADRRRPVRGTRVRPSRPPDVHRPEHETGITGRHRARCGRHDQRVGGARRPYAPGPGDNTATPAGTTAVLTNWQHRSRSDDRTVDDDGRRSAHRGMGPTDHPARPGRRRHRRRWCWNAPLRRWPCTGWPNRVAPGWNIRPRAG